MNALAGRVPKVRRLLQPGRGLPTAEAGASYPSPGHALLTAALFLDVAGILARKGLARIGEIFAATRADLVLPSDVQQTMDCILLAIQELKTRHTAAKHQAPKLDHPHLMRVV